MALKQRWPRNTLGKKRVPNAVWVTCRLVRAGERASGRAARATSDCLLSIFERLRGGGRRAAMSSIYPMKEQARERASEHTHPPTNSLHLPRARTVFASGKVVSKKSIADNPQGITLASLACSRTSGSDALLQEGGIELRGTIGIAASLHQGLH